MRCLTALGSSAARSTPERYLKSGFRARSAIRPQHRKEHVPAVGRIKTILVWTKVTWTTSSARPGRRGREEQRHGLLLERVHEEETSSILKRRARRASLKSPARRRTGSPNFRPSARSHHTSCATQIALHATLDRVQRMRRDAGEQRARQRPRGERGAFFSIPDDSTSFSWINGVTPSILMVNMASSRWSS